MCKEKEGLFVKEYERHKNRGKVKTRVSVPLQMQSFVDISLREN